MRHRALHLLSWILSRLAARGDRDALMGDLAEEYALRSKAASSAALRWYLQQLGASVPSLLWARLRQPGWLATFGLALVAYIAVGVVELIVNRIVSTSGTTGAVAYNPLTLVISSPMVVLIGYCAARLRRRAATVLAVMMLVAVTAMNLTADEIVPLWYRIAYFVVGPASVFAGAALHSRRRHRVSSAP